MSVNYDSGKQIVREINTLGSSLTLLGTYESAQLPEMRNLCPTREQLIKVHCQYMLNPCSWTKI